MARARRSAGRRADLRWIGGRQAAQTFGAGVSGLTIVSAGNTSQTIMRTRGTLYATLDSAQAPGVQVEVGCAFLIQQSGATPTSHPLTDADAPYFWYTRFVLGYEEMVADVVGSPWLSAYREVIDSKALRVLRPDQEIAFVFEQQTIGNAASIDLTASARFLLAD